MLQKLKITTCVLFLGLFGLTLAAVSNVSAREGDSEAILACAQIKTKVGKDKVWKLLKEKKNCFADLARALNPAVDQLNAELSSLGAAHEKSIEELQAQADNAKENIRGEMQALVDKALEDLLVTQASLDKAEADKVELQAQADNAKEDIRGEMQALVDKALEDLLVVTRRHKKAEQTVSYLQALVDKAQAPVASLTEGDWEKKYNDVKHFINWNQWRFCTQGGGNCTEKRYLLQCDGGYNANGCL